MLVQFRASVADPGPTLCTDSGLPFQRDDRLYTSESDVCRRRILTHKECPSAEIIKIFIMAVDP